MRRAEQQRIDAEMHVFYTSGAPMKEIANRFHLLDPETVRRRLRKLGVPERVTPRNEDLAGQVFGRLTVQGRVQSPSAKNTHRHWRCLCSCGHVVTVCTAHLRAGHSTSCGCSRTDRVAGLKRTHGLAHTPEYKTWIAMKQRCLNPKATSFRHYGGRGITVCERWRDDFVAFLTDVGPKPSPQHSIERSDNNGPYAPDNCSWAVQIDQMNNNRRNRYIEYRGERRTFTQWLRATGLPKHTFLMRVIVAKDDELKVLRERLQLTSI